MQMITRKGHLAQNLNLMKKGFPNLYDFFPETWVFPRDKPTFKLKYTPSIYIVKPKASSQGRGIFLTRRI